MESDRPQQVTVKQVPPGPPPSGAVVFWEKYGNRILLGLTVLALLYALVQYRRNTAMRATEAAWENLIAAREKVSQFRSLDLLRLPPDQIVAEARTLEQSAGSALDAVIDDSDQSKLLGQAYVTRGDLYWTLANLPEAPGAATQPALRSSKTPTDYLASAADAYRKAVDQKDDVLSTNAAHLGLAAVAENRGEWDEAKKQYDAVATDAKALPSMKTLATFRGKQVDDLRRPLFVTLATRPAELLTTTTGPSMPTTMSTTMPPTTIPAPTTVATTQPTTVPAP